MSEFTLPLTLTMLSDCKFRVAEKFEYHVGYLGSGDIVQVPVGFITDLTSVPRFLWFILPPHGYYGKAAVIHDFLLEEGIRPRKECDQVFKEGMEILQVPKWKIWVMYISVRLYGVVKRKLEKIR